MATIDELGQALAVQLQTISGLRVSWLYPDTLTPPMAVITYGGSRYHQRSGDGQAVTFEIEVWAAPMQQGIRRGQEKLIPYLDKSGTQSIKAALEADTSLGGKASSLRVTEAQKPRVEPYGDVSYWVSTVVVEVRD